ncbi:MAG: Permease YjgP/YjgQ family protein [Candidatus Tokpelaia hoelldobleri]|uniref:Permease YjgP/YjgQ family protein n=1 Tax=Candidatus Tokpelaia hoelldobleri TaxID=1902579 RepID=A0A1U9JUP5_9HYPH|nr:MAG: Permease YjgP/YjgQ family protein [Candidatus Tokpelaia hoelldoblerii]
MIGWTLGRYFFMRYVRVTFYFLLAVFMLSLLLDFTINASRIANLPGYSSLGAFAISALRIPFIMQQIFPFVALFSAMVTLISLNRRLELVVTRASGVSVWQFLFPFCLGAFLFGLLAVVAVNPLASWGTAKAENIISAWRGNSTVPVNSSRALWLTQRTDEGTATIGANMVLDRGRLLEDVTVIRRNGDDTIYDRLNARSARLEKGYWQLFDVYQTRRGQPREKHAEMRIATLLEPEFVEERFAEPESIPFYELPHKIKVVRSFGYPAHEFDMYLQSIIALPALLVAMTLIAATVSLKFMRSGQSDVMILGGILAGFVLYVVTVLARAFGNAGIVPPIIAAWIPVLIAVFFSVSFLLYREDG